MKGRLRDKQGGETVTPYKRSVPRKQKRQMKQLSIRIPDLIVQFIDHLVDGRTIRSRAQLVEIITLDWIKKYSTPEEYEKLRLKIYPEKSML